MNCHVCHPPANLLWHSIVLSTSSLVTSSNQPHSSTFAPYALVLLAAVHSAPTLPTHAHILTLPTHAPSIHTPFMPASHAPAHTTRSILAVLIPIPTHTAPYPHHPRTAPACPHYPPPAPVHPWRSQRNKHNTNLPEPRVSPWDSGIIADVHKFSNKKV